MKNNNANNSLWYRDVVTYKAASFGAVAYKHEQIVERLLLAFIACSRVDIVSFVCKLLAEDFLINRNSLIKWLRNGFQWRR